MDKRTCIRIDANTRQLENCKSYLNQFDIELSQLSNTLSLVGNDVRLKIIFLIKKEKQLCVCDLSDILGLSVSAISQHLRKLKDKNILKTDREAQLINYSITEEYIPILSMILSNVSIPEEVLSK